MLRLVSTEMIPVTANVARKFRDMKALTNERELKAGRAKNHLNLLRRGNFFTPLWGSCEYKGDVYRGNGNHTSRLLLCCLQAHTKAGLDGASQQFFEEYLRGNVGGLVIENAVDLPEVREKEITACVESFTAETHEDLVEFFRRYDSAASARSQKDLLGIYIGESSDLAELSRDRVRYALNGVLKVCKTDPASFGVDSSSGSQLSLFKGSQTGAALRIPGIIRAVKWIVETVPDSRLYKNAVGASVCAEIYATYGDNAGAKIVDKMIEDIEADNDPAAAFEAALNKRHNKPTPETILKKGRTAVREIAKSVLGSDAA